MLIYDEMHSCGDCGFLDYIAIYTHYYDEDHWSNEGPYEMSIISQPAPAINQQLQISHCYLITLSCMFLTLIDPSN